MTTSPAELHTLTLETRGYDLDTTGYVSMPMIFRYFEHKRWTMMRDPRLGLVDLVHAGHFFVVRDQTIEIVRHVGQGVTLVVETRFLDVGRSTASVRHTARRAEDGALVAQARVRGVWIGPQRHIGRLPDSLRAFARAQVEARAQLPSEVPPPGLADPAAPTPEAERARSFFDPPPLARAPIGVDEAPADGPIPDGAYVHTLTVPPRDRDIFSHVNAATWLGYVDDARVLGAAVNALPADAGDASFVARAGLLYLQEAVVADTLRVHVWPLDEPSPSGALALGAAITRAPADGREGSPDRLVCARLDLAPGARAIAPC